ncbi:MAG: hypothetical protein J6K73_07890 [Clostridia bacterium]|nr:hypothetical protein [Clostridia bacterium]
MMRKLLGDICIKKQQVVILRLAAMIVSRIGVIKPPVELGVNKKNLRKKASYAILRVVWQPQKQAKEASS